MSAAAVHRDANSFKLMLSSQFTLIGVPRRTLHLAHFLFDSLRWGRPARDLARPGPEV